MDAADKAHGQTADDSEDISGGMGLLTPEGPAVDAEEEAFIRAMKRKKKKKRNFSIHFVVKTTDFFLYLGYTKYRFMKLSSLEKEILL